MSIENITYLKTQIVGQLEDARRRLEDEERRRSLVEASLHQVWFNTFIIKFNYSFKNSNISTSININNIAYNI